MQDEQRIGLLRHGETEGQGGGRLLGQADVPLSETGLRQARWWREEFARMPFERCCCSDLARARRTAEIVAESMSCAVEVLPELREIHLGEWEGLTRAEICARFPGQWEERGRNLAGYRPAGGESFEDLSARVVPAFERIRRGLPGNALIVSHAGVNRIILCHVLGMPLRHLFRLEQAPGSLNIIQFRNEEPRVAALNRVPPT